MIPSNDKIQDAPSDYSTPSKEPVKKQTTPPKPKTEIKSPAIIPDKNPKAVMPKKGGN